MKSSFSAAQSSSWIARLLSWLPLLPLLLCLLAFSLRVFRLDFQPIWFDEDLAYQRATAALDMSLSSMAGSPLYYIILRGWAEPGGSSLYALRLFSALCGTLVVPLSYQVARPPLITIDCTPCKCGLLLTSGQSEVIAPPAMA